MPRRPADLPSALPWPVFTRAEALQAGIPPDRLRRSDLERLRRGVYARKKVSVEEVDIAAALCRRDPKLVIVGLSAARILGYPLPLRLERWTRKTPLHVARFGGRGRSGTTVTWHDLALTSAEVRTESRPLPTGDLASTWRVTTPARTWRDLAARLDVPALVAVGDHLLRIPRPELEGRSAPWTTRAALTTAATGRHAQKLRAALALVRIGADSPKETELRLAFRAAGLPEPEINRPLRDSDGIERHSPDFQWPEFFVCAEYEGSGHNDPEQVQRDIARARAAREAGFLEIRLAKKDLTQNCAPAIQLVSRELLSRGWRPSGGGGG